MARRARRLEGTHTVRRADGGVICERCVIAGTPWTRMRGLLRTQLQRGDGLLIKPTNSIHMFFMGYAIDAVFLDKENRVVRIAADLAPWKLAAHKGARSVLEMHAGECAARGLELGDQLTFIEGTA